MPTDTFKSFATRIDVSVNGLSGVLLKQVMNRIGVAAKKDATGAASADLGGDPKFSGWAPTLDTRFEHVGEGRISFHPTKRAAGPWTVAQFGRNAEGAPSVTPGKKRNRYGNRRYNGVTKGKGTAEKALTIINRETPHRLEAEVKKVLKKSFG